MSFDGAAIAAQLTHWLDAAADVISREGSSRIWVFSRHGGAPVFIFVEDDEARVFGGFAFRTTLVSGDSGQESDVIDCVEGVITGHAREYFDFTDTLAVDDRSHGAAGFAFEGRGISSESPVPSGSVVYEIPAWPYVPARP